MQTAAGFAISSMILLIMYLVLFQFMQQNGGAGLGFAGALIVIVFNSLLLIPNYLFFRRLGWASLGKHVIVGVLTSTLIFALVNVLAKGGSWEMGLTLVLTLVPLLIFFQVSVIVFWFTSIRGRHQP